MSSMTGPSPTSLPPLLGSSNRCDFCNSTAVASFSFFGVAFSDLDYLLYCSGSTFLLH